MRQLWLLPTIAATQILSALEDYFFFRLGSLGGDSNSGRSTSPNSIGPFLIQSSFQLLLNSLCFQTCLRSREQKKSAQMIFCLRWMSEREAAVCLFVYLFLLPCLFVYLFYCLVCLFVAFLTEEEWSMGWILIKKPTWWMDEFSTEALKKQIRQNLATRMQRKISLSPSSSGSAMMIFWGPGSNPGPSLLYAYQPTSYTDKPQMSTYTTLGLRGGTA